MKRKEVLVLQEFIDPNERKRVNTIITDYLRARKEMHRVL